MTVSSAAFAQNITVSGVVTDSSTGQGIPFASLMVKGTMTGTSTDGDGLYFIDVPANGTLVFSSIGTAHLAPHRIVALLGLQDDLTIRAPSATA